MSSSLIGGAIGATIGFFVGGPTGAQYGFMLGSMAGGLLFPPSLPDQFGPRREDLTAQASEYGKPIPIVFGTIGISGNVIWASDLIEIATETEQGGKGGSTQSTTTYAYYGNFAIVLCEGVRQVGRIWAGPEKRLIWDGTTPESGSIRIYTGTDTQLPDPLIESYMGVGNAPAYRGTCYIVLENFALANDGNMIPFLTVEVGEVGASTPVAVSYFRREFTSDAMTYNPVLNEIWATSSQQVITDPVIVRFNATTGAFVGGVTPGEFVGLYTPLVYDAVDQAVWGYKATAIYKFDATTGVKIFSRSFGNMPLLMDAHTGELWCINGSSFSKINKTDGSLGTTWPAGRTIYTVAFDATGINIWFSSYTTGTTGQLFKMNRVTGSVTLVMTFDAIAFSVMYFAFDSLRNRLLVDVTVTGNIHKIFGLDIDTDSVVSTFILGANYADGGITPLAYDAHRDLIWTANQYSATVVSLNAVDGSLQSDYGVVDINPRDIVVTANAIFMMSQFDYGYEPPSYPGWGFEVLKIGFGGTTPVPVPLATVVADLSARAGLASPQYDVTALADLVDGYAIARQTTARAAIDALRPAYYFDAVESGGVVKYVKRGSATLTVIPDDDLAAHDAGSQSPDPLMTTRQMEVELPKSLAVNYLLAATDYGAATKLATRLIGSSQNTTTLDLPLVLTDTKAQEVSEVNLHGSWVQRLSYGFSLPKKYADLEPTDLVVVKGYTMRLTKITATPQGVLQCEAIADDANFYTPAVVVTETVTSGKVIALPGLTRLELM